MWEDKFNVPSDDAASSPHQSDGAIVEGPAELFGCLPQQHEALRVGNDLGGVEGLQTEKLKSIQVTVKKKKEEILTFYIQLKHVGWQSA